MKLKRIIALLTVLLMLTGVMMAFASCGDEPVADDPTADAPTTDDPTTDDPTTDDPTTDDPTTDDPTTDDPTTDDPTTDDPTTDDPTTDDPTEDPTTDDPTTDDPTTDDPTTDDPTTDDPTTDDPTEDDPTTDDEPVVEEPIVLVENRVGKFKFVTANGVGSDVIREVESLISELSKFAITVERVADSFETISEVEVLIGEVQSRGDAYKLDPHVYGYDGYTVKAIDGKVLVLGGSTESLVDAIDEFKKNVLGINKKTKEIVDVTVAPDFSIEEIQDDYDIKDVLIAKKSLREFSIALKDCGTEGKDLARELQSRIYKDMGIWLPILDTDEGCENAILITLVAPGEICENGFEIYVKDGKFTIVSAYSNQLYNTALGFYISEILNKKAEIISFDEGYIFNTVDVKNVYYADFGAVGDGKTDDFAAIKAAHDFANKSGNVVHAGAKSGGAKDLVYYLGKGSGSQSIIVKTDTYLHGCKFIFDDSKISAPPYENGQPTGKPGDPEYNTPIFKIASDKGYVLYGESDSPIKSLSTTDTKVEWAPGEPLLVVLYNKNVRRYIRFGPNANSGAIQQELIIIDKDGNIDPSTPPQWDFEVVTELEAYSISDTPIVFSGADKEGEYATVDTIVNDAEAYYTYYSRNFYISRSNVTFTRIRHNLLEEELRDSIAPYNGFISVALANNVTVDDCILQAPRSFGTTGSGGTSVGMGTYEIGASFVNNLTLKNCTQSNFYNADGTVRTGGPMGTNYCKNMLFENMLLSSFDAHCGLYNATIRNSTCEHLNFIGSGTIRYENVTVYVDGAYAALSLRSDYGSTWRGDVIIDGLTVKYMNAGNILVSLIKTEYTNHDFGYATYLPTKITMNNVKMVRFDCSVDAKGNRTETVISENQRPIYLYRELSKYKDVNIADPDADMTNYANDLKACTCTGGYADGNGDSRCDTCKLPKSVDRTKNINPYTPTEEVYISNSYGLTVIFPDTPQFKDMKVFVSSYGDEYEEISWRVDGQITAP